MTTTIKATTYIKNQTNHYHYHGTEPEPLQEVLIEESHDTTEDVVEAEIQGVKQRRTNITKQDYESNALLRLIRVLYRTRNALNQRNELSLAAGGCTVDLTHCLKFYKDIFSLRIKRNAHYWYLTDYGLKLGKRLNKKKYLPETLLSAEHDRSNLETNRKKEDNRK